MAGVIVLRVLNVDKEMVRPRSSGQHVSRTSPTTTPAGWGTVTPIGPTRQVTTIVVETLLFDVAKGRLIWGASPNRPIQRTCRPMSPAWRGNCEELQREGLVARANRNSSMSQYFQPIEVTMPTSLRAASGLGGALSKVSNMSIENENPSTDPARDSTWNWIR